MYRCKETSITEYVACILMYIVGLGREANIKMLVVVHF